MLVIVELILKCHRGQEAESHPRHGLAKINDAFDHLGSTQRGEFGFTMRVHAAVVLGMVSISQPHLSKFSPHEQPIGTSHLEYFKFLCSRGTLPPRLSPTPQQSGATTKLRPRYYLTAPLSRLGDAKADPAIKHSAIAAVPRTVDASLKYAKGNAFDLINGDAHRRLFSGFFSTSGGTELVRAHYLTGKADYLAGGVRSSQFQLGCNPNNLVYKTGLGCNPIKHPLHLDSRFSGQAAPEGLMTFGDVDYWNNKGEFRDWPIPFISKPGCCCPDHYDWPLAEAYFDMFLYVSMNEYVIDSLAPNITG